MIQIFQLEFLHLVDRLRAISVIYIPLNANVTGKSKLFLHFTGNIAKGKPAIQSTNYPGGAARHAVDGNKNPNWSGKSCTHTQKQANPWWRVDLRRYYTVGKVQLTNRGDCCANRLRNFEIRVGNRDRDPKRNRL